jgi:hypothetical protein
MADVCRMCGKRESEHELCRTENHDERWLVCSDCAQIMLGDPNLAGMWQRTGQERDANDPALISHRPPRDRA